MVRRRRTGGDPVRSKLKMLEELVPGCTDLDAEAVLARTADYITLLQLYASLLKGLSDVCRVEPPSISSSHS